MSRMSEDSEEREALFRDTWPAIGGVTRAALEKNRDAFEAWMEMKPAFSGDEADYQWVKAAARLAREWRGRPK